MALQKIQVFYTGMEFVNTLGLTEMCCYSWKLGEMLGFYEVLLGGRV